MTQQKRPSFFKRTYLINPTMQWRFTLQTVFITSLILSAFYYIEKYLLLETLQFSEQMCTQNAEPICQYVDYIKGQLDLIFLIKILMILSIVIFWSIYFTHRIAGPLYRIKRTLNACLSGKRSSELKTRKHDYFSDMNESINKVIKHFNQLNSDDKVNK